MSKNSVKVFAVALMALGLFGCKTSEDKLIDLCVSKLEAQLENWASYDGWSTKDIRGRLYSMTPDLEKNKKYNTDMFYNFEVILDKFTVKNGYNADVNSVSSCTGYVAKDTDGEYAPPSETLTSVTLGDKKLGL